MSTVLSKAVLKWTCYKEVYAVWGGFQKTKKINDVIHLLHALKLKRAEELFMVQSLVFTFYIIWSKNLSRFWNGSLLRARGEDGGVGGEILADIFCKEIWKLGTKSYWSMLPCHKRTILFCHKIYIKRYQKFFFFSKNLKSV